MEPGRDAADAEAPLRHHAQLHAEGGLARARHDVPHRDRAGEPRFRLRGRHGQEAARLARAAAGRDGAVRELALHRGPPNGFLSMRSEIWRDTDNHRAGMLPRAFDEGFGYEAYVDWALDVPMYFVKRDDTYHDVAGASFRDLLAGRLAALPGEVATRSDWANHVSTLFPEVRLKRYLEMRGADVGPPEFIVALSA